MEDVIEQLFTGRKVNDIARDIGVSPMTVWYRTRRYNSDHGYCLGMMMGVIVDKRFKKWYL
jgi:hypothetical protein